MKDGLSTVQELEAQLFAAKAEEKTKDRERKQAQDVAWKLIVADPDSFEWKVEPFKYIRYFDDKRIPTEGAQVAMRVKPEILQAWNANGYGIFSNDYQAPDRWFGMFYYRTEEGILTRDGGGYCVLKVFRGEDFDAFLREVKTEWRDVRLATPRASRDRSKEVYLVMRKL